MADPPERLGLLHLTGSGYTRARGCSRAGMIIPGVQEAPGGEGAGPSSHGDREGRNFREVRDGGIATEGAGDGTKGENADMEKMSTMTVIDTIGNTPLVELRRMAQGLPGKVLVKLENRNPLGSVKDRIGRAMIEAAEESGALSGGATIVEATSGNTGIALAYVGAAKGYKVILAMPETMSIERRRLLVALGARLELTDGSRGMKGALERAREIVEATPGAVMMSQFSNAANPAVHESTTGPEIWRDTRGEVDIFVAGVGTGGTITGTGRALRARKPEVQLVAVEPAGSPVLSGGEAGPHMIQGIGAGFVPEILDTSLLDRVMQVTAEESGEAARRLAREEGIFSGISAGANVHAALTLAADPAQEGKTIVTVVCDTGERYLSTWLYEETIT